jgi:transposase
MDGVDGYEPQRLQWAELGKQLSPASRTRRLAAAVKREALLKAVATRKPGESERAAVRRLSGMVRSSFRRWQQRYAKYGLDGLMDWRMAPKMPTMPPEARAALCTLRRMDANISVATMVQHLAVHHHVQVSETTVKRVLREEGLARRRGPVLGDASSGERHLELGGMKLVEAALVETGYLKALSVAVGEQLAAVPAPESAVPPDGRDRDEWGRFLSSYNEQYKKKEGDAIGPGFASIESKRVGLDPSRLHVSTARQQVIERKILGLMTSHLLGGGRWDGIRQARGALLEELCGFGYMPSTLDLFSRELKYVGVSSTLWEVHARLWLGQTAAWGSERDAVVLYVDETNKPVWTDLFSQSSKVSNVGKVMPSLETVCFHSGYGVPLWMVTHSGRMPLVKAVPVMLNQFREMNDGAELGRIVVIDAEGNSVPSLKQLEQGSPARAWVTRFKPSLLEGKRIFNRTNYQPYRNGDRVRIGLVDLNDPAAQNKTFRVRVVEVERRSKGTVTYLGASTLLEERDWKATEIADLYFERWPKQEANFRAVNQALGLKEVHGYGKQLVDNVTVVTELDELGQKIRQNQEQVERRTVELKRQQQRLHDQQKLLGRWERRNETLQRQLHARVGGGQRITPKLRELAAAQKAAGQQVRKHTLAVSRSDRKTDQLSTQLERQRRQLEQHQERQAELDSRRRIFKHDVELDSLFSVLKVGLVLTIMFVLKQYLGDAHMEALTFLDRVATLPARLRILPDVELLTFAYNQRDPEVMALLTQHCEAINARALRTRSGRTLRVRIDPAPPPLRPPPDRTKSTSRFHPG